MWIEIEADFVIDMKIEIEITGGNQNMNFIMNSTIKEIVEKG